MTTTTGPRDDRDPQPLAAYLRELRWALGGLPENDRDEIVAEARSHLLDRVDTGTALPAALGALGSPRDYARPFLDTYEESSALTRGRARDLLPVLVGHGARSFRAAATLAVFVLLWAPALALAGTAIIKVFRPEIAGLWVGPAQFFIGTIDDPSSARELLGAWIFPLAVVGLVTASIVTRRLASAAVRRLGSTPRP